MWAKGKRFFRSQKLIFKTRFSFFYQETGLTSQPANSTTDKFSQILTKGTFAQDRNFFATTWEPITDKDG